MNKRIDWIDSARGIGIFCVYLYHTGYSTPYRYCFEYFLIPIFFFISGYLFNETRSPRQSFSRLIRRLLTPYLALGFVIGVKPSYIQERGVISALIHSAEQLLTGRELWFIACLITMEAFVIVGNFITKKTKITPIFYKLIVILVSFIMIIYSHQTDGESSKRIWQWYNALLGIGYFYMGSFYKIYEDKIQKLEKKASIAIILFYIVASACSALLLNTHIDFASAHFVNPPICLLLSWMALWALICLCKRIGHQKILCQLGKDTLFLFAINIWAIKSVMILFSYTVLKNLPEYIYGILISIVAISIASLINKFIRKFQPWIIGES